ncbi:MAG TPA: RecX family transcriptional regulator [Balneolaceae bacterium]|nr:RecX family transcriptional regulator [Balneolaceae bacterium]
MADEEEHHLPGVITSISIQKNNKERYSIFVDEAFLMGIAEQTLLEFNLTKGVEITPKLFRKLQREEGRFAVKSYLIKLLGRRDHARKELLTKAIRKEYPKEVIDDVLNELEQKGYINDAGFAEKFASDKSRLNKWGPHKIKAHLFKKGIPKSVAEESIRKAFEEENLEETFLNLVLKHKRRFLREEDEYKRRKKIFDHLARKGYRSSDIYKHLDTLMKAIKQ